MNFLIAFLISWPYVGMGLGCFGSRLFNGKPVDKFEDVFFFALLGWIILPFFMSILICRILDVFLNILIKFLYLLQKLLKKADHD